MSRTQMYVALCAIAAGKKIISVGEAIPSDASEAKITAWLANGSIKESEGDDQIDFNRTAESDRVAKEAADKAEADRIAKETADKAEADRVAQEAADKAEADRIAKEAADKAEADRIAQEAADKAEADHVAKEAATKKASKAK